MLTPFLCDGCGAILTRYLRYGRYDDGAVVSPFAATVLTRVRETGQKVLGIPVKARPMVCSEECARKTFETWPYEAKDGIEPAPHLKQIGYDWISILWDRREMKP